MSWITYNLLLILSIIFSGIGWIISVNLTSTKVLSLLYPVTMPLQPACFLLRSTTSSSFWNYSDIAKLTMFFTFGLVGDLRKRVFWVLSGNQWVNYFIANQLWDVASGKLAIVLPKICLRTFNEVNCSTCKFDSKALDVLFDRIQPFLVFFYVPVIEIWIIDVIVDIEFIDWVNSMLIHESLNLSIGFIWIFEVHLAS